MDWLEQLDGREALSSAAVLGGAVVVGILVALVAQLVLRAWSHRSGTVLDDLLARYTRGPLRLLIPLVLVLVALPAAELPTGLAAVVRQLVEIGCVGASTWLALRGLTIAEQYLVARYDLKGAADVASRSLQTRARVGRNIGTVVVVTLGAALVLTTIESVRELGASLLASAGVAGIVVGIAAQRTLGTLFAGIQIALTEPIRIGDVVIVQGEWGRIEEIALTYVVLRVWDERRLVIPITWFVDQPFQNWTRNGSEILGTVELKVDPEVPVDAVRAELDQVLARHPDLWDGRVKGVQVTDMTERTVTVRVLVSAADAGKQWDLRCVIREEMLAFLRARHPEALARVRLAQVAAVSDQRSAVSLRETPGAS